MVPGTISDTLSFRTGIVRNPDAGMQNSAEVFHTGNWKTHMLGIADNLK